jgi:hypothetical protein
MNPAPNYGAGNLEARRKYFVGKEKRKKKKKSLSPIEPDPSHSAESRTPPATGHPPSIASAAPPPPLRPNRPRTRTLAPPLHPAVDTALAHLLLRLPPSLLLRGRAGPDPNGCCRPRSATALHDLRPTARTTSTTPCNRPCQPPAAAPVEVYLLLFVLAFPSMFVSFSLSKLIRSSHV